MKIVIKNTVRAKALMTLGFCAIVLMATSLGSCKKEDTTSGTTTVAFEHATIKPLFDKYCASCHASGKSNANQWLYNAADYNASIKAAISNLYKSVYTNKTMPQGATLTTAELTSFKSWYDSGYPAK